MLAFTFVARISLKVLIGVSFLSIFLVAERAAAFPELDPNFHSPRFVRPEPAQRMALLPDGKFLRFFPVETLVDQDASAVTRYLPDGTLDTSFHFPADYTSVRAAARAGDGKIVVSAVQYTYRAGDEEILRLNDDGSIDPTFSITEVSASGTGTVGGIVVQPDGKILVSGFIGSFAGENRLGIVRLLADGGLDPGFAFVPLSTDAFGSSGSLANSKPALQTDGKIIIFGNFRYIGSSSFPSGIARLNSDGTLDSSFQPSGFVRGTPPRAAVIQPDGKILVGGRFTVPGNFGANPFGDTYTNLPIIRLNSDGSVDQTYGCFSLPPTALFYPRDLALQSDGKAVAVNSTTGAVFRFQSNGALDSSFTAPQFAYRERSLSVVPVPYQVAVQSDDRILISGSFSDVDTGTPLNDSHYGIVRLLNNGAVDPALVTNYKTGYRDFPASFSRLPDHSTLIGFKGIAFSGEAALPNKIGRLFADGSLDMNFNPLAGSTTFSENFIVNGFARLSDGKFLLFGREGVGGNLVYGRLLVDGNPDNTFAPDQNVTYFEEAYPLANGSVVVFGSDAQGLLLGNPLRRLLSNGSLDHSFIADPSIVNGQVVRGSGGDLLQVCNSSRVLAVQPDGKVIFIYLDATSGDFRLERLRTDGSVDDSFATTHLAALDLRVDFPFVSDPYGPTGPEPFQPPGGVYSASLPVTDAALLPDGRLVLTGFFTSLAGIPARSLVRLKPDGTVDSTFQPGGGAQWTQTNETTSRIPGVEQIELQSNGHLLVAGSFEAINGVAAPGIASLSPDGLVDTSFVPPAIRQKSRKGEAVLARQPDGSFLLSGPYSLPNESLAPSLIRIVDSPSVVSPLAATVTANQPFIYLFEALNTTSFAVNNLPPGLSYDVSLHAIVGTPTAAGTFQIELVASNGSSSTTQFLTLTIQANPSSGPVLTSSTSATGRAGSLFTFRVVSKNGTAAARLNVVGLPPGLTFDAVTGMISGTANVTGNFAVNLTVTNGNETTTGTLELSFSSDLALPVITSPTVAEASPGQAFSYQITAPSTAGSNDPTTFSIVGTLPDGLTFNAANGTISGTFNGTGEEKVQLFATNSRGVATLPLTFRVRSGALNISTRAVIGADPKVLIAGFIVTGNAPKKFVLRAVAPSLNLNGVPLAGTLPDPVLTLDDHGVQTTNDDWRATQEQEIINLGYAPADNREAVIVVTLNPGAYTAIVSGKGGASGIGLVEAYDLGDATFDSTSKAQLANLSTRGFVQTGDNVMIGGFIVRGSATGVIVRAIGPSFQNVVGGTLQDTTLELFDANGLVASNDDWRSSQEAIIQQTQLAPTDDREAAIVATLSAGGYTAIVRGKNGTSGVALVEVYRLP